MSENVAITIETTVNAPIDKVWRCWNTPEDITKWAGASDDWHTTFYESDLRAGGEFRSRMEAKDGSAGFDLNGTYDAVETNGHIAYTMDDGRKVNTTFADEGDSVKIVQTFDAENENPIDLQRAGWQAILDNFKKYTENV